MFKRIIFITAVLALSAFAARQVYAANPQTVNVNESEWKVDVSPDTATTGVPVEFHIKNTGKIVHEFVIEKAGEVDQALTATVSGKEVEAESENIQAGESRVFTWTFTQPGKYWLACHIKNELADHFAAGMVADFTVTGNPVTLPTAGAEHNTSQLYVLALGAALLVVIGFGLQKFTNR